MYSGDGSTRISTVRPVLVGSINPTRLLNMTIDSHAEDYTGAATPELLRRLEPVSHLQGVGSKPSTPELMRRLQPVGKSPTSPLRRMRLSWERGGAQESGEA